MGHCCQASAAQRGATGTAGAQAAHGKPQKSGQAPQPATTPQGEGADPKSAGDAKEGVRPAITGGMNNEQSIEAFLRARYPLGHGFEHQRELEKMVRERILKKLQPALAARIFDHNVEAASWSNRRFETECELIVDAVEKEALCDLAVGELARLARSIDQSPDRLNKTQKTMVLRVVCNSVIAREYPNADVSNAEFYKRVASEVMKKLKMDVEKYLVGARDEGEVRAELIREATKQALRRMNLKSHHVTDLVRHFNLLEVEFPELSKIKGVKGFLSADTTPGGGGDNENEATGDNAEEAANPNTQAASQVEGTRQRQPVGPKDRAVAEQLVTLALAMVDIYRESEDSAEFGEEQLREVIGLAGMRHAEVYRRLLAQLLSDIDNDHLLAPDKLRCLAAVLLAVAGRPRAEAQDFCTGDDLNSCLKLVTRKFDTVLLSDDNENLHAIYDTLNIVLTLMAAMRLRGMRKHDCQAVAAKLKRFRASAAAGITAAITGGAAESPDGEGGLFPLRVKCDYGAEALKRIGGVKKEEDDDDVMRVKLGVQGAAGLLRGFVALDMRAAALAVKDFHDLAAMAKPSQERWFEAVQAIQTAARLDFNEFQRWYLGGAEAARTRRAMQRLGGREATERVAFYVIEALDQIARDRTRGYDDRIHAVDALKAMHVGGKSADARAGGKAQEQDKEEAKDKIDWFERTASLQYYIRDTLGRLSTLPGQGFQKTEIGERAKGCLTELQAELAKAKGQEVQEVRYEKPAEFSDTADSETNALLVRALNEKMPVADFLASIRMKGSQEYDNDVKGLCLIEIQGEQYVDGKIQKHNSNEAPDWLREGNRTCEQSELFKHFSRKRKKAASLSQGVGNKVVNHVLLFEGIPLFLTSPSAVMLIQGDAGTGKSVFLKRVEQQIWKAYERGHTDFIPIFVRLAEVLNPSNCVEELMRSQTAARATYSQMKNSKGKFLFLLDGYDELKAPKNMYLTNRLAEWRGTVKVLTTSRQEYLAAYGNYQKYFKPPKVLTSQGALLEYRISEVSKEQRRVYIEKRVHKDQNTVLTLDKVADKEQIDILNEWGSLDKYETEITTTKGLEDLIRTPYMLTIIINILPELEKQKTSDKEGVTKSTIYKTFTKQHFQHHASRLMDNEGVAVPKGYDLETSFYNYSLDIAIEMYLSNKTSVPAIEYNYSYPARVQAENKFEKFFKEEIKVTLARSGAQLIIMDGKARFTHKSIMEYFAARVIYEQIKLYAKPTDPEKIETGTDYSGTFMSEKLIKGSSATDSESDVLNFVVDMVRYNHIKQSEMKSSEEEQQQSIHAWEKLTILMKAFNKKCVHITYHQRAIERAVQRADEEGLEGLMGDHDRQEVQYEKVESRSVSLNYLGNNWQYNILLVASHFPELRLELDDDVRDAIYKSDKPQSVRDTMLLESIKTAENQEKPDTVQKDQKADEKADVKADSKAEKKAEEKKADKDKEEKEEEEEEVIHPYGGKVMHEVDRLAYVHIAKRLGAEDFVGAYARGGEEIKAEGAGTVSLSDGAKQVGTFVNGELVKTGKIKHIYKNKDVYEGAWEAGRFKGEGTMKYADGGKYEGEWKEDKRDGKGTMTHADGRVYKGPWEAGAPKGDGVLENPMGTARVRFDSSKEYPRLTKTQQNVMDEETEHGTEYKFDFEEFQGRGSVKWEGDALSFTASPATGFPQSNFELSVDFKTTDKEAPLFCCSEGYRGAPDRELYLSGGVPHAKLWGGGASEQILAPKKWEEMKIDLLDDQWHSMKLQVAEATGKQLYVDGALADTITDSANQFKRAVTECRIGSRQGVHLTQGTVRNVVYQDYRPPGYEGKFTFQEFSGKDLEGVYGRKGLDGTMKLLIKATEEKKEGDQKGDPKKPEKGDEDDDDEGGEPEEKPADQVYEFKGNLTHSAFHFDPVAAAAKVLEWHRNDEGDPRIAPVIQYMQRCEEEGGLLAAIYKADREIADYYMSRLWGEQTRRRVKLTLASHPGLALVKDEEKSKNEHEDYPLSHYELGPEDESLMVLVENTTDGQVIKEFFNQTSAITVWASNLHADNKLMGHRVGQTNQPYQQLRLNADKTISPARRPAVVLGCGTKKDKPVVLVAKDDERRLVFKEVPDAKPLPAVVIPLVLTSHEGKAIVWAKEKDPETQEDTDKNRTTADQADRDGWRQWVCLGDEQDAIRVFLDEDGHICCADYPYQCMDARERSSNRDFLFYSKHGDWRDQKFTLNDDGTIALKGSPGDDDTKLLGTDAAEVKVKYVRDLEREAREDAEAEEEAKNCAGSDDDDDEGFGEMWGGGGAFGMGGWDIQIETSRPRGQGGRGAQGRGGRQRKRKGFRVRSRWRPKAKPEDHIKLVFRDTYKLLQKKKMLDAVGEHLKKDYDGLKKELDEKAAEREREREAEEAQKAAQEKEAEVLAKLEEKLKAEMAVTGEQRAKRAELEEEKKQRDAITATLQEKIQSQFAQALGKKAAPK